MTTTWRIFDAAATASAAGCPPPPPTGALVGDVDKDEDDDDDEALGRPPELHAAATSANPVTKRTIARTPQVSSSEMRNP